jgi:nucleoside-diphosphate-sugar epimerase
MISQLSKNNDVSLGNLYPKRDFIYVDDAITALYVIFKKSKKFNVYNIGSGKSTSILEIFNILKNISKKHVDIQSVKTLSRKQDIPGIRANISKISQLGWKPKIAIRNGLKLTYENL